jgi:hydroxymethylpyrimidine pyrophosphatase-like HAD family hydrolase
MTEKESQPRIIAFDFDGVIATYNGFVAHDHVKEPNQEVLKAMHLLKDQGYKIMVHSTRGDAFLKRYCEEFSIPVDYINRHSFRQGENPGKPIAFVYVDDRAICYRGDKAEDLVTQITNFKAYWQS